MPEIDPIFISVKQAAGVLGISPWSVYQLLDAQVIESRYHGKRRLVRVTSLQEYAEGLPSAKVETEAAEA